MSHVMNRKLIERACDMYVNENLEIDPDAQVEAVEDGHWVQAWVWVPIDQEEENASAE